MSDVELAHSTLGASNAHRWMRCPGSVAAEQVIDNRSSSHAALGTAAHEVAEWCLHAAVEERWGDADPRKYLGLVCSNDVLVTEEITDAVQVYVDYCVELMGRADEVRIEHKFSLSALHPPVPMFGTSDFTAFGGETLHVVDYKNGFKVVEVTNNVQVRYYALGAWLTLPEIAGRVSQVTVTIVQPRAYHDDGPIRSETFPVETLVTFAAELMQAARATQVPNAPLVAGDHCTFCRARPLCPEHTAMVTDIVKSEFATLEGAAPPAPDTLPLDVLADVVSRFPVLEAWMEASRALVQAKLAEGVAVPGWKLVRGQTHRKWAEGAESTLLDIGLDLDSISPRKLLSVAKVEAELKRRKLGALPPAVVVKPEGSPTLVRHTDKRDALVLGAHHDFLALPPGESTDTNASEE